MTSLQSIVREFEEKIASVESEVALGFEWAVSAIDQLEDRRMEGTVVFRNRMQTLLDSANSLSIDQQSMEDDHKKAMAYLRDQLVQLHNKLVSSTGSLVSYRDSSELTGRKDLPEEPPADARNVSRSKYGRLQAVKA